MMYLILFFCHSLPFYLFLCIFFFPFNPMCTLFPLTATGLFNLSLSELLLLLLIEP
ncbi:hypothetical protein Lalb_Chr11g0066711 [Lupinus albus]|uniref:Uncharacterized protein n=1 Tax=Lupinus albus TaxID=3870 RepID=A0A6A4PR74_LUPAL|nr:hypothetical protein Lalb_Chr11g0066711 [Lupinus albus]